MVAVPRTADSLVIFSSCRCFFFICAEDVYLILFVCKLCTRCYYAPTVGTVSVAFVRPSVCPSACPSVAYIANNSRTQRPSVPKFRRKVPHLRCDSHTGFKVKQSKVRVRGGRRHTVSAEPGGHTACSS